MSSRKHLHHFEGGNALSDFRARALLERLRAAVGKVESIRARYLHVVWSDAPLAGPTSTGRRPCCATAIRSSTTGAPTPP